MGKKKVLNYSKKFKFDQGNLDYTFQIRKKNWKWLWLLLLLPLLLLFIRCEREINITTVNKSSHEEIPHVEVTMHYTSHYLYKDGKFFTSESNEKTVITDDDGKAVFSELGCSVYSYIFYCLSKAQFSAVDDCHICDPDPNSCNFHYTWSKEITVSPKLTTLYMNVVDKETMDPLADAEILYEYELSGSIRNDTAYSNAAGNVELENVPECGSINFKSITCYGYEDIINMSRYVPDILSEPDSAVIAMTPLKQSFSYFVKNKFTKEPLPGATVNVTLSSKNGKVIRGKSTTNVDGKGRGAYEDAFILAKVELKASKINYKDGFLEDDYTVEQFANLPDSMRVVYLEPEPYMEKFQNVDSISGEPVAGVSNNIHRASIDGNEYDNEEISNRNGIFYVKAIAGDHINIHSEHKYYEPKDTEIDKFSQGEIIKLQPKMTSLKFRTVDAFDGILLEDCDLDITTGNGKQLKPSNSGNGEFKVDNLRYGDILSITASKSGYATNSFTVHNDLVEALMSASQRRRDIPLEKDMLPCEGGATVEPSEEYHQRTYNLGRQSGHTTVNIDFDSAPDYITIYDGPDTSGRILLPKAEYTYKHSFQVKFTKGCITVVVEGTTHRDYIVHCP